MSNLHMPIITIELESMRHTLRMALTENQIKLDKDINAAIDKVITPENIAALVNTKARQVLEEIINKEVDEFFRYGVGRAMISDTIKKNILANTTYTRLDEF